MFGGVVSIDVDVLRMMTRGKMERKSMVVKPVRKE